MLNFYSRTLCSTRTLSLLAAECKQTAQENILKSCNLTKNVNNKEQKSRKCQIFNFLFEIWSQIHCINLEKFEQLQSTGVSECWKSWYERILSRIYKKGATEDFTRVEEFSLEIGFCFDHFHTEHLSDAFLIEGRTFQSFF